MNDQPKTEAGDVYEGVAKTLTETIGVWAAAAHNKRFAAILRQRFPLQPSIVTFCKRIEQASKHAAEEVIESLLQTYGPVGKQLLPETDLAAVIEEQLLGLVPPQPDESKMREACEAVVVYFYDDCHETCPFCSSRKAVIVEEDCFPHEDDCLFVLAQAALAASGAAETEAGE